MPPAEALIWGFWFLSLLRPLWRGSHPPLQGFPDPCMDPEPTPGRSHGQVDRAGHEDFLVCSLTVIYAFGGQAGAALWVLWETRLTAALSSLGHHVLARTCTGRLSWGLFSLSTPLLANARVAGFSRWMKDPGMALISFSFPPQDCCSPPASLLPQLPPSHTALCPFAHSHCLRALTTVRGHLAWLVPWLLLSP